MYYIYLYIYITSRSNAIIVLYLFLRIESIMLQHPSIEIKSKLDLSVLNTIMSLTAFKISILLFLPLLENFKLTNFQENIEEIRLLTPILLYTELYVP